MKQPVLYLMVGYPGAGKTTIAKLITEATGAEHVWADWERHKMFGKPNHSETESAALYAALNKHVAQLLAGGTSVIFDTNFNYAADRRLLHDIAARNGAETVVLWVTTPPEVARERAVHSRVVRNGYDFSMTPEQFEQVAGHLEPPNNPNNYENVIKIDGTKIDEAAIKRQFSNRHA